MGQYEQILYTVKLMSIRHRTDIFALDRCVIDLNPTIFAISDTPSS